MKKSLSKKRSFRSYVIHFFIGILFGWMLSVSALSWSWGNQQFYQSGRIYDVDFLGRMSSFDGVPYDAASGSYTIQGEDVRMNYQINQDYYKWNYVYLTLNQLNAENIQGTVEFYLNGALQLEKEVTITEGKNYFTADGVAYNQMQLHFVAQTGKSFTVTGVQFRTKQQFLTVTNVCVNLLLGAIAYWLTAFLVCRRYRERKKFRDWNWYVPVEWLQTGFIAVGNLCAMLTKDWTPKRRSRLRCFVLTGMILFMSMLENLCILHSKPYYGLTMLCMVAGILACAIISIEKPLERQNWKNPLVGSWMALWVIAIISDFFVDKRYQYQGWIMIFIVGFFFFCWGNLKKRGIVLWDLMRSGELAFFVTTIFVYFCRPIDTTSRFSGFFRNPNIEASFCAAAVILFLVEIDRKIAKKKMGAYGWLCVLGLIVAFDRTWRTAGRAGQLAALGAIAVFFLYNLFYGRRNKTMLMGIKVAAIGLLLVVPVLQADDWIFNNLAEKLGTTVVYPKDQVFFTAENDYQLFPDRSVVYAAENETEQDDAESSNESDENDAEVAADALNEEENLPGNTYDLSERRSLSVLGTGELVNTIEAYSSGRTLYYLAYIRQMNLLGHYYHARNWGDYIYPHNGMLELMYRYGIFALIPYCSMIFYCLWYGFLYAKKNSSGKTGFRLYPLLIAVGAVINLLFENVEKPFVWLIWVLLYIGMGILFPTEETEDTERRAEYAGETEEQ